MTRRRVHERYDCEVPVTLLYEGRESAAIANNVSLGGMFVCTDDSHPLATVVTVRFEVPGVDVSIDTEAIVRWHKPSGFGVQFQSLRAREVWALNRWFSKLAVETESA